MVRTAETVNLEPSTNGSEGLILDEEATTQLRDVLHNNSYSDFESMLNAVYDPTAGPQSGRTYWERAVQGGQQYVEARNAINPGKRPAKDVEFMSKLYEVFAIAKPEGYGSTSGDIALVLKSLLDANPTPELREYIERLERGDHLGVFLLTEGAVGSNASAIQTTVTLNLEQGTAELNTPTIEAAKFMPNVADVDMPKITIVAARLIVDEVDQGIVLVTVPMHTDDEPAGISMEIMGDKSHSAAMPHAQRIQYKHSTVPIGNVILGSTARIENGQYINDEPNLNKRYHEAISSLGWGRLGLSSGSIAAVWAALDIHMQYAGRREVGRGETIAEQDDWQHEMAQGVVDVCALTALSNAVRRRYAEMPQAVDENELLAWLEKPLITSRAREIVMMCADRTGSRGHFDANLFPIFLGNIQGAHTAEGIDRAMSIASGRAAGRRMDREMGMPLLVEREADGMVWHDELVAIRADTLHREHDFALGKNGHAVNLSKAIAERYALDSLVEASESTSGAAREVLRIVADIYALEKIEQNFGWYYRNNLMTPEIAAAIPVQLAEKYQAIIPLLPGIVNAFGIPERLLNAPITSEEYAVELIP